MAGKRIENPTSEPLQIYGRARWLKIDKPVPFQEGDVPRYEATFILDPSDPKGQASVALILSTAAKMSRETYGVVPLAVKKLAAKFIPGTKKVDLNDPANADDGIQIPFKDGDTVENYAGYQGMLIVPAHNSRLKPAVVNRKGVKVQEGEPQYPYDGCYVNGSVTLWVHATHGSFAKRVGCNLRGVQFAFDGDRFTQDEVSDDEFQAMEDDAPAADTSDFD